MAGDWIKLENVTPDKPEVFRVAEILGIEPDAVVGKLARLWIWADQQTYDGDAGSVTVALLDSVARVPGFGKALLSVGWLVRESRGFVFPNFDRHNGETAKRRALTSKRMAKHRAETRDAPSVTVASPEKRREEKRREEKKVSTNVDTVPTRRFKKPTLDEVKSYCQERKNRIDPEHFIDHYEARGWKVKGGGSMKDWRASIRTWEKNSFTDRRTQPSGATFLEDERD